MLNKKFFLSLLCSILFLILLTGCIKTGDQRDFGGIFKSIDKGENFQQKVLLSTPKAQVFSIGDVNVLALASDPEDHNAIYLGTEKNGLYYSYDGAESWYSAKSLENKQIDAIAVSPSNKCHIYAVNLNKIFLSKDCNRTYEQIFNDPRGTTQITELAVSKSNPMLVMSGTSQGDVLKSTDGGTSWTNVGNFKSKINAISINDDVIFAASSKNLNRSADEGVTWEDLSDKIKDGDKTIRLNNIKNLVSVSKESEKRLILATEKDILVSKDNGESWELLKLLSSSKSVKIYSLAANPLNPNEIYYGTAISLIKSNDGGNSWISAPLPSSRIPFKLMIDFEKPSTIYMGMYKLN